MKKTICSIISGLMLTSQVFAFNIPDKFKEYRTKMLQLPCIETMVGDIYMHIHLFTKDGKKSEVVEMYPVVAEGMITNQPLVYMFDLNNDGKFSQDETLVDTALDGLNRNEKVYSDMVKEYNKGQGI